MKAIVFYGVQDKAGNISRNETIDEAAKKHGNGAELLKVTIKPLGRVVFKATIEKAARRRRQKTKTPLLDKAVKDAAKSAKDAAKSKRKAKAEKDLIG